MIRTIITAILLCACSSTFAFNWPWSDTEEENLAYCKGFVVGGLASYETVDDYRTDLWLAWNYLIRQGAVDHSAELAEFQAGRANFTPGMGVAQVQAVLDDAANTCGLGRSGLQVTGW